MPHSILTMIDALSKLARQSYEACDRYDGILRASIMKSFKSEGAALAGFAKYAFTSSVASSSAILAFLTWQSLTIGRPTHAPYLELHGIS